MITEKKGEWVFIVNPIAGNSYAATLIPKINEEIAKHRIDADVVLTERKGHASELASQYVKSGVKYVVAVGGDGTLNEIARVLVNNQDIVLGVIPAGTGNDFIQILGFPNRFEEKHWDVFFQRNLTKLDVGNCNGIPFFNGMGLGFDAEVAAQNYDRVKGSVKKGGKDKYIWHIVKTLLLFREKKMKVVTSHGEDLTDCFINTISVGRRFAGGFFLTPKAIANDGLLDVCMVKKLRLFQRFRILLMVPKGTHIQNKKVNYYQTARIQIGFPQKVPFHVDGELYFDSMFDVQVQPQALNAIYNPKGNHFLQN
ncbi:MAG TPA: diacylglycerol kinase family lipid kinase [Prolixibacteraceae bacterium]|nr:diacylglycerol kinase family lipid kinase [Prolixibacteraceae bacterium]